MRSSKQELNGNPKVHKAVSLHLPHVMQRKEEMREFLMWEKMFMQHISVFLYIRICDNKMLWTAVFKQSNCSVTSISCFNQEDDLKWVEENVPSSVTDV